MEDFRKDLMDVTRVKREYNRAWNAVRRLCRVKHMRVSELSPETPSLRRYYIMRKKYFETLLEKHDSLDSLGEYLGNEIISLGPRFEPRSAGCRGLVGNLLGGAPPKEETKERFTEAQLVDFRSRLQRDQFKELLSLPRLRRNSFAVTAQMTLNHLAISRIPSLKLVCPPPVCFHEPQVKLEVCGRQIPVSLEEDTKTMERVVTVVFDRRPGDDFLASLGLPADHPTSWAFARYDMRRQRVAPLVLWTKGPLEPSTAAYSQYTTCEFRRVYVTMKIRI